MEFWTEVLTTIITAVFIAAVAYGGVLCGKNLRVRKNAKIAQENSKTDVQ
ncbi:MAG: hypothetical protein R3Y58_00980 [Eubacteriales bacterium]